MATRKSFKRGSRSSVVTTVKDLGAAHIILELQKARLGATVKAGLLGKSVSQRTGRPLAAVLNTLEFGDESLGIPERPAVRDAFDRNEAKYIRMIREGTQRIISNGDRLFTVLHDVAFEMEEDIKESLETWTEPGNAPRTISNKGFDKPFQESGKLIEAITSKVEVFGR